MPSTRLFARPYNTKGFGGVSGAVIELDEGGGATKQVAEYRNLVEKRNVDAVVGYISSGNCQALAPIAEELKQFTIFATCGTPRIFEEAERKYVFRTMGHATADNVAAAMYVKEKFPNTKGYTGINQNYAWGQDSWRDFDLTMQQIMSSAKASANTQPQRYLRVNMDQRFLLWHWIRLILFTPASGVVIWRPLFSRVTPVDFFKEKIGVFTVGGTAAYRLGKKAA